MPKNFRQVDQNLYRGGAPSEQDLKILSDNFNIKRIVSLDDLVAHEAFPTISDLGIEHIVIPLSGSEEEVTSSISYLINNIVSLLNCGSPTYVHCRHGSDRTGLAVGLYRVLNDGWDSTSALNEAKQYQFGQRIPEATKKFYSKIIDGGNIDKSDVQDNDMVQFIRDTFEVNNAPPAFPPQQTFAPEEPAKFQPADELLDNVSPAYKDHSYFSSDQSYPSRKRKRELRRMMMEGIAQVGQYDNYEGVRGVGLGPDAGGFSYPEGDGVPGGAGFSETGGWLNIG